MKRNHWNRGGAADNRKKMKAGCVVDLVQDLTILSSDELSCIVSFLHIGEALMLCMTCKSIFTSIEKVVRHMSPLVLKKEGWSIAQALRTSRNGLIVSTSDDYSKLATYLEQQGLAAIPRNLVFNDYHWYGGHIEPNSIWRLLSSEMGEDEQMEVVKIDWTEESIKSSMHQGEPDYDHIFEKSVEKLRIRVGFTLQSLTIRINSCSRLWVYRILSCCRSLESLTLSVSGDWALPEEERGKAIISPILKSLRRLVIEPCYNWTEGMQFIVDLLQFTPNLEELEYEYMNYLTDSFLKFLAKQCPNLKKLCLQYDMEDPTESDISDEAVLEFLNAVPSITELILPCSCNVSGEIFTKIGNFPKLKVLCIERDALKCDLCDQYDNIHFGGGVLPRLEALVIRGQFEDLPDDFADSIVHTAPNIKRIVDMGTIDEVQGNESPWDLKRVIDGCPMLTHVYLNCVSDSLISKLVKKENLVAIELGSSSTVLTSKHLECAHWYSLSTFIISGDTPSNPDEWLHALLKACPNLERLALVYPQNSLLVQTLLEILSDINNWPKLSFLRVSGFERNIVGEKVSTVRPLLVLGVRDRGDCCEGNAKSFIREWLFLDKYERESNKLGWLNRLTNW